MLGGRRGGQAREPAGGGWRGRAGEEGEGGREGGERGRQRERETQERELYYCVASGMGHALYASTNRRPVVAYTVANVQCTSRRSVCRGGAGSTRGSPTAALAAAASAATPERGGTAGLMGGRAGVGRAVLGGRHVARPARPRGGSGWGRGSRETGVGADALLLLEDACFCVALSSK